MKRLLSFLYLSLLPSLAVCQNVISENLDLSEGRWELYVLIGEGPEKAIGHLHNYYTNDTAIIRTLLNDLIDSIPNTSWQGCAYYSQSLLLLKDGIEVKGFGLNHLSGIVNINDIYYDYDPDLFSEKMEQIQRIESLKVTFNDKNKDQVPKLMKYCQETEGVLFSGSNDSTRFQFESRALITTELDDKWENYFTRRQIIRTEIEARLKIDSSQYLLEPTTVGYNNEDRKSITDEYVFYGSKKMLKKLIKLPMVKDCGNLDEYKFTIYGLDESELEALLNDL